MIIAIGIVVIAVISRVGAVNDVSRGINVAGIVDPPVLRIIAIPLAIVHKSSPIAPVLIPAEMPAIVSSPMPSILRIDRGNGKA